MVLFSVLFAFVDTSNWVVLLVGYFAIPCEVVAGSCVRLGITKHLSNVQLGFLRLVRSGERWGSRKAFCPLIVMWVSHLKFPMHSLLALIGIYLWQAFAVIHVKVTTEPLASAPQQNVAPVSLCLDSKVPFALPDSIDGLVISHRGIAAVNRGVSSCVTDLFPFGRNTQDWCDVDEPRGHYVM